MVVGINADQESFENKIICFNSSNRASGTSHDAKMHLGTNLQQVIKVGVRSLRLYNSFYNITALNNSFNFFETGIGLMIPLPLTPGNYSLTEILNYQKSAINALSLTVWSWSFSSNTGKITWTNTGSITGNFLPDTTYYEGVLTGMNTSLGYSINALAHPYVSGGFPDVDISEVHIEMKGLKNTHNNQLYTKGTLCIVPISSVAFGSVYQYQSDYPFFHILSEGGINMHDIHLTLRDSHHNIISNNNIEWSCEIVCLLK